MGLFVFAIVWLLLAIGVFAWLHSIYEWSRLSFGAVALRALLLSLGLSPGLVAMHDVAVMPLWIALFTQPRSELWAWNVGGWLAAFASSLVVAAFMRRLSPPDASGEAQGGANAP